MMRRRAAVHWLKRVMPLVALLCMVHERQSVYAEEPPQDERPAPRITKPPKLVHFVEAIYPPDKQAAGIGATVMLSVEIGEDGKVGAVTIASGAGLDFDAAALAAVKQFLFEPAEIDDKPAPVKITYRYNFSIRLETVKRAPQVNFDGIVVERFTRKRLSGVKVTLKNLGISTQTGPEGEFSFTEVPEGKHIAELSGPNLITVSTEETLVKDKKKTVKYLVEEKVAVAGVDEEVVVRAPRIRKESVETSIRTEEARRVPGTQGDTLKVVQNLPGVARSAFGSGQLVIWGSSPQETRVMLDGVEIPALYHVGGLRSTVNSDLVRSIELTPGGYGAEYGGGLGGLIKIETQKLPERGVRGYLAADVLDASGMISVAVTPRLRLAIAGRYSYLDRILPLFSSANFGDFVPIPSYDDYQVRATLTLRKDEELSALFLASDDHLRRSIGSQDPAQVRSETTDQSFKRFLLRYSRLLPDGASFMITPSFGFDSSRTETRFGGVPTELSQDSWRYGLRASYRRRVARPLTLSLGLDFSGAYSAVHRVGSVNLPPREGDVTVFGQPPGDDVSVDRWTTHIAALNPYAFVELVLGKLTLTPGIRLGAFALSGNQLTPQSATAPPIGFARLAWAIDPRLTLAYQPHRRLGLHLAAGLYHQPPEPRDLSAVFGNPRLGLAQAVHLSAGAKVKITGSLSLETVGFFKYMTDLVTRSEAPTPPVAQVLVQEGIGRSYGGQLLLRQEVFRGLFGWISYSLIRAERKDHPGRAYRLFDFDQTHALAVLASYTIGRGFTVGTRFRFSTGFPRTPVKDAFYDARGDQYQPIFGEQNSIRLPAFYQLDLRAEKEFRFRGFALNLYLDVQNVTNRQNPEEIIYNYNYTTMHNISGLPTLAIFGVRLERL